MDPQAFAKSYDIEVYANDDTTFSTANKVNFASAVTCATRRSSRATPLPASNEHYLWRVRRTDADNNKGPWSAAGRFKVTAGAVTLLSPPLGGSTPPNGAVLQWSRVVGAATYAVDAHAAADSTQTLHDGRQRVRPARPT